MPATSLDYVGAVASCAYCSAGQKLGLADLYVLSESRHNETLKFNWIMAFAMFSSVSMGERADEQSVV
jgi:hypothetical protein